MIVPDDNLENVNNELLIERLEKSVTVKTAVKKDVQSTGIISDLFDKKILTYLEQVFSISESGDNSLSAQEFKNLIAAYIPSSLVDTIYRAIDVNDVGFVNYSDFTNYLISAEAGSTFSNRQYLTRLVLFGEQDDNLSIMHRDFIDCMVYVKKPCPMLITGGRDGQVSLWDPSELNLIKNLPHRDSNSVYQEDLYRSMDTLLKAHCLKSGANVNKNKPNRMAITSMCALFSSGMICIGSADGCMTIYELGNQEVCGRFALDAIPTSIECFSTKQHFYYDSAAVEQTIHTSLTDRDALVRYIAIGDSRGIVHILKLHAEFELSTEVGMKKKNQILFTETIKEYNENKTRRLIHSNWITQMRFVSEIDLLITASVDGTMSFFDINRMSVTKSFYGHKESNIGVKCFSWSSFSKYIVSGGDRTMLFWDPYTLDIVMNIDAFRSPIVTVEVHDACNKVFAVLSNKTINIWHNITFELLQTINDPTEYRPTDNLSAMTFSIDMNCLFTAGNKITSWKLERSTEGMSAKDDEDLCVALFNPLFRQTVLVKSLGLVKVYQAETGEIVRTFKVIPVDRSGHCRKIKKDKQTGLSVPMIKSACFDKHQTRLIVTAFDWSVQFWNINDGTNLLQLMPQLYSTTLAHIYASLPKCISTVNYELHYSEGKKQPKKLIFIGTEHGNVCGYQESNSIIDDVPVIFLRLTDQSKDHTSQYAKIKSTETTKNGQFKGLVKSFLNIQKLSTPSGNKSDNHAKQLPNAMAHREIKESSIVSGEGIVVKDKVEKDRLASTDSAVLWTHHVQDTSTLIVAYLNGVVTFWDLDKLVRTHNLPLHETGPILIGMKIKGDHSHQSAPHTAAVTATTTALNNGGVKANDDDSEHTAPEDVMIAVNKPFSQMFSSALHSGHSSSNDIKSMDGGDKEDGVSVAEGTKEPPPIVPIKGGKRSSVSFNHRARSIRKNTLMNLPEPEPVPTPVDPNAAVTEDMPHVEEEEEQSQVSSVRSVRSGAGLRQTAADLERQGLGSTGDNAKKGIFPHVPPTAAHLRRDSAANVVSARLLSRNFSIAIPRKSISMNMHANYGDSEDVGLRSLSLQSSVDNYYGGGGLHMGASISSLQSDASSVVTDATSISTLPKLYNNNDSQVSNSKEASIAVSVEPSVDNVETIKIIVDCVVVLTEAQVIIGACNDKYLRFWDLSTHNVLCSCCYYHRPDVDPDHEHKHVSHPRNSHGHEKSADGAVITSIHPHRQTSSYNTQKETSADKKASADSHTSRPPTTTAADTTPTKSYHSRVIDEAPVDEVLRHLSVSDSEDLLIGGYDNGMIRVWSIQSYSVVTLRSLLIKHLNQEVLNGTHNPHDNSSFGYGLAISPITLLHEWTAHSSPILSIEYIWFDYGPSAHDDPDEMESAEAGKSQVTGQRRRERQGDMGQDILEGYILSAGVDQKVYLWSVHNGKSVGEFGSFGWDIHTESTWYRSRGESSNTDTTIRGGYVKRSTGAIRRAENIPARLQTSASMITKDDVDLEINAQMTEGAYILKNIGRYKSHTTSELNTYVEELTKKIINKPPAYTDVAKQFTSIMTAHPMKSIKDGKKPKLLFPQ